jgi:hypothetical protein
MNSQGGPKNDFFKFFGKTDRFIHLENSYQTKRYGQLIITLWSNIY